MTNSTWLDGTTTGRAAYLLETALSVKAYGATGDGTTNDATAIQNALNAGASRVFLPPGSYLINGDLIIPTGVNLYASHGSATLLNAHVRVEGSQGSEIAFTAPVTRGSQVIQLTSTTGLAAGGYLRLVSCINSQSTDAGTDQLGGRNADFSFLSEFVEIKSVDSSTQVTLQGAVIWPYSNTPGAQSSTRTTSTAIPVTFNSGVRVTGVRMLGRAGSNTQVVNLKLTRDCIFEDCDVDVNNALCYAARTQYCLDTYFDGGRYVGTLVPTSASHIVVVFRSSTECATRKGARIENGYQGVDVTYNVTDSSLWGGPSIACGSIGCVATEQSVDGFTDHPGCFRSRWKDNTVYGDARGIRVRSRDSVVDGNRVVISPSAGIGINIEGGFLAGCLIVNNQVDGGLYGISYTPEESVSTSHPSANGTARVVIKDNVVRYAITGIYCASPSTINGLIHTTEITGNTLLNITTAPIYISSYCNGTIVRDNVIWGVTTAAAAGIRWEANIKRLTIGKNYIFGVGASSFALKGPSTASFITDTTTFPLGNAEAFLSIDPDIQTDAATPFSGIIRDVTAYKAPRPQGWRGFASDISTVVPTTADLERNTFALYWDGTNIQAVIKDSAGTVVTKAVT